MKKSFVILLALVLLISGTGIYAQTTLVKERDQVHFEETFSYGNKALLEGATVEMYNALDSCLFWHTTYKVGAVAKEMTEYEFHPWYYSSSGYVPYGTVETIIEYYSLWTPQALLDDKEYYALDAAYKELYDKATPNVEEKAIVYLKDYMEYYSFGLSLEIPMEEGKNYQDYNGYYDIYPQELESKIAELEQSGDNPEELKHLYKIRDDWKNFNEFFKIPVIEKEIYGLSIIKDEDGKVYGMVASNKDYTSSVGDAIDVPGIHGIEGLDLFRLDFIEKFYDGNCYLTFDPRTSEGNLVDTSHIPGGYGIYCFGYDSEKGTIDSKNIQMVYAMSPEVHIYSIDVDASGKNLMLRTEEAGREYLEIVERESMTLVQKIDLGNLEDYCTINSFENCILVENKELSLYEMDENGYYNKIFSVSMEEMQSKLGDRGDELDLGYSSGFAWNGEILLCASYLYDMSNRYQCGFGLAAVDATGLVYYGRYESSLMMSTYNSNTCYPDILNKEHPVMVYWER